MRIATALTFVLSASALAAEPRSNPDVPGWGAPARGFADLAADRHGTPARPAPDELGLLMVFRTFQTVCLSLEEGMTLPEASPPGFAPVNQTRYMLGPDAAPGGAATVLSVTGDIETDEAGGHPAIWVTPSETGTTCELEWAFDPVTARVEAMPQLIEAWLPFQMALLRQSPPVLQPRTPDADLIAWQRPCGGGWCDMQANYNVGAGRVTLTTVLALESFE